MTCWVIIPTKPAHAAKGRLAEALSPDTRMMLVREMLKRAINAASQAIGASGVILVGGSRNGLSDTVELIPDPEMGLNAALDVARAVIANRSADRIVSLAADLPQVCPSDISALCTLPSGVIGIAPDRHNTGTNALSLPLPEALGFVYAYGPDSFSRHKAEAERLGLKMQVIATRGLAHDIDEPADLADVGTLLDEIKG